MKSIIGMRALRSGFGGVLMLAFFTLGTATYQTIHFEEQARLLVVRAERTTYLIGDLGQHVALLQAHALESVTQRSTNLTERAQRLIEIERSIDRDAVELRPLLGSEVRRSWAELLPTLDSLRSALDQVLVLARWGRPGEARAKLDEVASLSTAFFDSQEHLAQVNRTETKVALELADQQWTRLRTAQLLLGGSLLIGMGIAQILVEKTLRRQGLLLTKYVSRLKTINQDLDAFAGRIAHDLSNILFPLSMAASSLKSSQSRPHLVSEIADRISTMARRSATLLGGLLLFSRAGGPPGPSSSVVIDQVERALEDLRPLIERLHVTVRVEIASNALTVCSAEMLHVILSNLLSNAVKFLEGRTERLVCISARVEGGLCRIGIDDSGPGIAAAALPRIAEPFFRAGNGHVPGTGIGLATVKRVVAAYGGFFEVSSVEGNGTKILVALPASPVLPDSPAVVDHSNRMHQPSSADSQPSLRRHLTGA